MSRGEAKLPPSVLILRDEQTARVFLGGPWDSSWTLAGAAPLGWPGPVRLRRPSSQVRTWALQPASGPVQGLEAVSGSGKRRVGSLA